MPIALQEPFRAVFYSGFYAAFALGAYETEGVDVRLQPGTTPDAGAAKVLGGAADVMWGGPMRLLTLHNADPASPLIGFAEVVTRDPFYLVGRRPNPAFRFADLAGLKLATVSEVPTPWYCLQDDIRRAGIDPGSLIRNATRAMSDNAAALRSGEADVIQIFEPFVEQLLREGAGHIWYAAANRGPTSYTTLVTTRDFAEKNPEVLRRMTRAVARTLTWIADNGAEALAALVRKDFFPDMDQPVLAAALGRYVANGLYNTTPLLPVVGFVRLKSAMLSHGCIVRDVPYDECVETRYALETMK